MTFVDEDDGPGDGERERPQGRRGRCRSPVDPDVVATGHQLMPARSWRGTDCRSPTWTCGRTTPGPSTRGTRKAGGARRGSRPTERRPHGYPSSTIASTTRAAPRHTAGTPPTSGWRRRSVGDRPAFAVAERRLRGRHSPDDRDREKIQQLQFNPPNLPLFRWVPPVLGRLHRPRRPRIRTEEPEEVAPRSRPTPPSWSSPTTETCGLPATVAGSLHAARLRRPRDPTGTLRARTPLSACDPASRSGPACATRTSTCPGSPRGSSSACPAIRSRSPGSSGRSWCTRRTQTSG